MIISKKVVRWVLIFQAVVFTAFASVIITNPELNRAVPQQGYLSFLDQHLVTLSLVFMLYVLTAGTFYLTAKHLLNRFQYFIAELDNATSSRSKISFKSQQWAPLNKLAQHYNDLIDNIEENSRIADLSLEMQHSLLVEANANEAKLNALINSSLDAIITVDRMGNIVEFNNHAENIFGWSASEIINKNLAETIIPERFRNDHVTAMSRTIDIANSKILNQRLELPGMSKDGKELSLEIAICPLSIGQELTFAAFIRDISQQKESQMKLELAVKDAQKANQAKSRFLATMSHELRTPMNAVMGIFNLIRQSEVSSNQAELIDIGTKSGQQLLDIINTILDLSRMVSGKFNINTAPMQLFDLFDSIRDIMQTAANTKNLKLNFHLDPTLPDYVIGDVTRIRQVFINLIDNAIKFTEQGNITVRVNELANTDSTVTLNCEVEDSGKGIDEAFKEHLFEEFSMADESMSRSNQGTGLGLSICKQLVKKMGGTIEAHNKASCDGACFTFTLVLEICSEETFTLAQQYSGPNFADIPKGLRILLAEDNPANRFILTRYLDDYDIDLVIAENGEQAVEIATNGLFDLILMDISMPKMDGVEATIRIKASQTPSQNTPIIALTAHSMEHQVLEFKQAGMKDHLAKPCTKANLLSKISQWAKPNSNISISSFDSGVRHQTTYIDKLEDVVTPSEANSSGTNALNQDVVVQFEQYPIVDISRLRRLVSDVGREVIPTLFELYTTETKEIVAKIAQASIDSDFESMRFFTHTIKSSAASHANTRLSELARHLEKMALERDKKTAHYVNVLVHITPISFSELEAAWQEIQS